MPLGFLTAALYLFELWREASAPAGDRLESAAGPARPLAARICFGVREKESGTDANRALCLHAQSALPGIDSDCCGVCRGAAQLACGGDA